MTFHVISGSLPRSVRSRSWRLTNAFTRGQQSVAEELRLITPVEIDWDTMLATLLTDKKK